eukprot:3688875-Rhodomonas_salina.2
MAQTLFNLRGAVTCLGADASRRAGRPPANYDPVEPLAPFPEPHAPIQVAAALGLPSSPKRLARHSLCPILHLLNVAVRL